jgi:mannose/fructose/N-acetylgalactosamine-specific phosphotransferase system component IIC
VSIAILALLLLWGTVVALDLAIAPQGLLNRPIVAATVAGALMSDVETGILVGMVLELYAFDVLPVGAARYPDLGTAAVPAAVLATLAPPAAAVGVAGLLGLPLAVLGGWGLHQVRRWNALAVEPRRARVAAGDARAIWELQRNGFLRETTRGVAVTVLGLLVVVVMQNRSWEWLNHGEWLSLALLAGGMAAALAGAFRRAGPGGARRWLGVGLVTGMIVVLWR